ncbi:MAG: homoserine kinase [Actinomyces succiniciruminis]|uniref:Homoserine kinase n=1 Tax=Actinomyces succiniciruminis TaxID=1522002 RepID=A0A1L7RGC1_9ACTO|nr:homoserine kinase [Actinomyces succiniciruminis]MBE6475619.1 homoserine kinase [Actinomyces succiniciruminis]CED90446.1 Homoserine kinase [Actinomyces succiniciruminis]
MRLANERAAVRVPATTANMGPGFDSFGMAFTYYDEVEVRPVVGPTNVTVEGVGEGVVPTDDSNLVVRALRAGLEAAGAPQAGFEMRCINRIPHGGGMGSSASAAVAGLMLARGLLSDPDALPDEEVFRIATGFEGHPDNVAPAVFGGATVAWIEADGTPRAAPMPVDATLAVSLLVPPSTTRLSTEEARKVLPDSVPRADALFNTSRAAILMLALAGRPDLLMAGTEDRLHQEYRRGVLPASMAVMDSLREQGYPAVISGAGPTVLVLADLSQQTRFTLERHGWTVLRPGIDLDGAQLVASPA